ncbi:MAG: hypothetical protein UY21_C0003G0050 [Microgenomates group bacterium GW2011_GWA1_48_10]|nr:MAG: hypothetical protein UY21_C0003G0050 [Microgenomates group bacterium GW2011_GWA1_48_10]
MVTNCYASGFLYHPDSNQILLEQKNAPDDKANWSLIGCLGNGKNSLESFKDLARKLFNLRLQVKDIFPVYDYFHAGLKANHFILYAQVAKLEHFSPSNKSTFAWFSLDHISKLSASPQTKQDITVGQRVIASEKRRKTGERTIG